MNKKVLYKDPDGGAYIIAKKSQRAFVLDTLVDLLTIEDDGNILGQNMYIGSIIKFMPQMEPAEGEVSDEELQKMLDNVKRTKDYKQNYKGA